MTVPEAARVLGIGRDAAYRAAARGDLPTLRVGRRILVPVAALERLLGIQHDTVKAGGGPPATGASRGASVSADPVQRPDSVRITPLAGS